MMIFPLLLAPVALGQNVAFEADRWERSNDAIIISDMSRVEPQTALSTVRKPRHWKILEYETASLKGKCIASLPDTGAPAVTLPLNAKGWHGVYVGLGGMGRFAARNQENEVRLKLTNDVTYQHRAYTGARDDIEEVFFKAADLTGQKLHIAQTRLLAMMDLRPTEEPRATIVMYVKLVPLTDGEVSWLKHDRERQDTKRLIGTLNGFNWIKQNYPTTREEFLEDFENLRDTDFGTIYWHILGGGVVNYPSKLGTIPGAHSNDFPRSGDGYATASFKKFIAMGMDPTKLAIEAARSLKKKILIGFRVQAWQCPPQFEDYFTSDFYRDHPEWRTYDRDGTPVMLMSYAVPQVRQTVLGMVREVLAYKPDGIEMIYFRGLPLMLWEDAFSLRFQQKYGTDAKQVVEDDPRLYELRGEIMTEFMRELRQLLDETQRAHGRKQRYELTASVLQTEADNRRFGLDVERWVKEGLVDRIGIFPRAFHTSNKPMELEWFKRITKGTKVGVYPIIVPAKLPSQTETLKQVRSYYQAGMTGVLFWDQVPAGEFYNQAPGQPPRSYTNAVPSYWPLISRLGHEEELEKLQLANRPLPVYIPLKRYGDYWFGRWMPDVGF